MERTKFLPLTYAGLPKNSGNDFIKETYAAAELLFKAPKYLVPKWPAETKTACCRNGRHRTVLDRFVCYFIYTEIIFMLQCSEFRNAALLAHEINNLEMGIEHGNASKEVVDHIVSIIEIDFLIFRNATFAETPPTASTSSE
uniref:Uncharacterized protein n=1 Tax=Romanomermis culicivorax TaxID=13658 RepID=A0A915JEQ5_ROMCU